MTSIQKLLGHRQIDTTLIYARVHDRTVAADYYAAMANFEKSLDLQSDTTNTNEKMRATEHAQLLEIASQLSMLELGLEIRLNLVAQIRQVLNGKILERVDLASASQS